MSESTLISVEEYVRQGEKCPFCGSDNTNWDRPVCDGATKVSLLATCMNCDKQWYEIFTLTSIEEIEA